MITSVHRRLSTWFDFADHQQRLVDRLCIRYANVEPPETGPIVVLGKQQTQIVPAIPRHDDDVGRMTVQN